MNGAAAVVTDRPTRWGMLFDADRCVGCQTCTIACKQTNQTSPGVLWRKVLDLEVGTFPEVERSFLLTGCQHCDAPPCVPVCPSGATFQRTDGIVDVDYDVCIGCASCVLACPYQARTLVKHPATYFGGAPMPIEDTPAQRRRLGVAQKCTFCVGRIEAGIARGLRPGIDPEATPACANACISKAIVFGNLADPDDRASRMLAQVGGRQMHEPLGTNPHIFHLGARRANEMTPGPLQTSWDFRAAMNFIAGGLASGLMLVAYASHAIAGLPSPELLVWNLGAVAIMCVGLFFVFLKLGRKTRSWRVLARWQSSWMTRETYCVVVVFGGLAASLAWPHSQAGALTAVGAAGFLLCQALILHAAKGIPAWRNPRIPAMLVMTGLLEGLGMFVAIALLAGRPGLLPGPLVLGGVAVALMLDRQWVQYQREVRDATLSKLSRTAWPVSSLGHWLPAAAWLAFAAWPESAAARAGAVMAGIAAIAMGALWKYAVIVLASHFQGTRIPPAEAATLRHRSPARASAGTAEMR